MILYLQDALELMSVIAVIVNCALIGMSDLAERLFPGWGMTERIVLIVVLEVSTLALRLKTQTTIKRYLFFTVHSFPYYPSYSALLFFFNF